MKKMPNLIPGRIYRYPCNWTPPDDGKYVIFRYIAYLPSEDSVEIDVLHTDHPNVELGKLQAGRESSLTQWAKLDLEYEAIEEFNQDLQKVINGT